MRDADGAIHWMKKRILPGLQVQVGSKDGGFPLLINDQIIWWPDPGSYECHSCLIWVIKRALSNRTEPRGKSVSFSRNWIERILHSGARPANRIL